MSHKRLTTPTDQEINALVLLFSEQRFEAAETSAKTLAKRYPRDSFGFKALGAIYTETGRSQKAIDPMKKAIALDPRDAELRSNLGNAYKDLLQFDEAEKCYRKALSIDPGYASVYSNLGVILKDQGMLNDAAACYKTAIGLDPLNAESKVRLGFVLMNMGETAESEGFIREALALRPDYVEAIHALALLLTHQERSSEAQAFYAQALGLTPESSDLHNNHGNLLKELGQYADAEVSYRKALVLDPRSSTAYNNLGMVLNAQSRTVEAEAMYRVALAMKPDFTEAISNLGVTLMETGRLTEAEMLYRHALEKTPDHVALLTNLGCTLKELGRTDEAVACFRKSLSKDGSFNVAGSNLLFTLNYESTQDPIAMKAEAMAFGKACTAKAGRPYREWRCSKAGTLRIGFVSSDLYAHPVGYFLEGLVSNLDKKRFELYAYSSSPREDEVTASLKPCFKKWQTIKGVSDQAAAARIHNDSIDILIDLAGHTGNNRLPLFAYKPAPIQASWMGYFATTGMKEIDYWIGDPWVTPECDADHFTEKLWQLPETYLCFTPPKDAPEVSEPPAIANGFVTFGCFNNLAKINADVIALWARVLNQIPSSKLLLKTRQLDDQVTCETILAAFMAHGIDESRLMLEGWSPRNELLAAYSRVDFALDPFPYPGGTTSAEAFWMGVPVITKAGNRFLSRIGTSIVSNAGFTGWSVTDDDAYVELAKAAARKNMTSVRTHMRTDLMETPLFDAKRFAFHFGMAMSAMVYKFKEGITHE